MALKLSHCLTLWPNDCKPTTLLKTWSSRAWPYLSLHRFLLSYGAYFEALGKPKCCLTFWQRWWLWTTAVPESCGGSPSSFLPCAGTHSSQVPRETPLRHLQLCLSPAVLPPPAACDPLALLICSMPSFLVREALALLPNTLSFPAGRKSEGLICLGKNRSWTDPSAFFFFALVC